MATIPLGGAIVKKNAPPSSPPVTHQRRNTNRHHRAVQMWWKHSIIGNTTNHALMTQPSFHPNQEIYNTAPEFPLCRNIDEALHSFRVCVEEVDVSMIANNLSQTDNDTASITTVVEYDWLLDGTRDHDYHSRRSQQLIQELKAPEIDHLIEIRDIVLPPTQRLEFASFPNESTIAISGTCTTEADEGEEEFGEFQTADVDHNQSAMPHATNMKHNTVGSTDSFHGEAVGDEKKSTVGSTTSIHGEAVEDEKKDTVGSTTSIRREAVEDEKQHIIGSTDSIPVEGVEDEKKDDSENSKGVNQSAGRDRARAEDNVIEGANQLIGYDDEEDTDGTSIPAEVKIIPSDSDHSNDLITCSSTELEGAPEVPDWDLSTLEGRFLRRQIPDPLPDLVSLPQHFFEETDPTSLCEAMVRSLPWKHIPFIQKEFSNTLNAEQDMAIVEEHLMGQLMQLDGWLASVTAESLQQISCRKHSLELCNNHLRELNHSLTMADLYARQSKLSLVEARGEEFTGLAGTIVLLEAWDQRDIYRDLDSLLERCEFLFDQEKHLTQKIKAFGEDTSRLEDIVDAARLFSSDAHGDQQLSKLIALDDLRERALHVMGSFSAEIKSLLQDLVAATCMSSKKFCTTKYGDYFRAIVRIRHEDDERNRMSATWTDCIIAALLFEIERCFSRALLDPTNAGDSAHDKELLTLECALRECHGDYGKLKTVSHNLVTIRFEFEACQNYFPTVMHRLCLLLTDALYCHYIIVKWHQKNLDLDTETSKAILRQLDESKPKLWRECERVLDACMEEYLNFSTKKTLFSDKSSDDAWSSDLAGLHSVMQLTHQFCRIGKEFLGHHFEDQVTSLSDESCDSLLRRKLCSLHRKHLRSVHVESMNSLGSMLSRESWQLVPLHPVVNGLTGFCSSEKEFKSYLSKLVGEFMTIPENSLPQEVKLWENRVRSQKYQFFPHFTELGNPFEVLPAEILKKKLFIVDHDELQQRTGLERSCEQHHETKIIDMVGSGVYELVAVMVDNNVTFESRIAIQTCFAGFAKCTGRILLVMKKLPLIIADASRVIQNVTDLFLTTIFRLCAGNSVNENIILGVENPKQFLMKSPIGKRKNATPLIGFGRRSSSDGLTRPPQPVTARLEAEICAPLRCDKSNADLLKQFIRRAQSSLDGMVKLDLIQGWIVDPAGISPDESDEEYLCKVCTCFEKRQSAAWSCLFIAAVLDVVKHFALANLTKSAFSNVLGDATDGLDTTPMEGVSCIVDFADSVLTVVPHIILFSTRMASARAIGSRRIVEEISRAEWDTSRISESAHHYVDLVCGRYGFIWRFLCTSAKLPMGVRRQAWENVVSVGFATFLEGFARIPNCSTVGRSLMSMDLAAFSAGVSPSSIGQQMDDDSLPRPPTTVTQPRGRQYVDTYIKVSYLPREDITKWIETHFSSYHLNHCLALTGGGVGIIRHVESLYVDGNGDEVVG